MSKEYLTQKEALTKVGKTGTGVNYTTRQWLISNGNFDTTRLTDYQIGQFVVDDDIIKKTVATRYTVTFSEINIKINLNYAPSDISVISQSDQISKIKGCLLVQSSAGYEEGDAFSPVASSYSNFGSSDTYSGTIIAFKNITTKVTEKATWASVSLILWNDSNTTVTGYHGADLPNLATNNWYDMPFGMIRASFPSSASLGSSSKTPYLKTYAMTDSNGKCVNAKWVMRIPLIDNNNNSFDLNVGTNLDSLPASISSNYTFNYPAKLVLRYQFTGNPSWDDLR